MLLRNDFKNFSLTLFDVWENPNDIMTTWQENDIKHNKYYEWAEYWLCGFLRNKPLCTKWFIMPYNGQIFNDDTFTYLSKLGELLAKI